MRKTIETQSSKPLDHHIERQLYEFPEIYKYTYIYVSGISAKKEKSDNFPDAAVLAPKQRNNTL